MWLQSRRDCYGCYYLSLSAPERMKKKIVTTPCSFFPLLLLQLWLIYLRLRTLTYVAFSTRDSNIWANYTACHCSTWALHVWQFNCVRAQPRFLSMSNLCSLINNNYIWCMRLKKVTREGNIPTLSEALRSQQEKGGKKYCPSNVTKLRGFGLANAYALFNRLNISQHFIAINRIYK